MSPRVGYSGLQIALHWIVVLLVAVAWFSSEDMGKALRNRIEQDLTGLQGATPHTIAGGIVFAFILWRVFVRLRRGAPEPEGEGLQKALAAWGHRALYVLMIATPAFGAAAWYGKIRDMGEFHEIAGQALVILALGHAAVAAWHHFVRKDETLKRMLAPK